MVTYQTIINYLVRLGWSHGDQEIFSIEEIEKFFSIEKVGKSPAKFDAKKLDYLNNYFIKKKDDEEVINYIRNNQCFKINIDNDFFSDYLSLYKDRVKSLSELIESITKAI